MPATGNNTYTSIGYQNKRTAAPYFRRQAAIEITDERALKLAGLVGEGAWSREQGVEYVLRSGE